MNFKLISFEIVAEIKNPPTRVGGGLVWWNEKSLVPSTLGECREVIN